MRHKQNFALTSDTFSGRILGGGMAEWTKAAVLKIVEFKKLRGFESHSHRQMEYESRGLTCRRDARVG